MRWTLPLFTLLLTTAIPAVAQDYSVKDLLDLKPVQPTAPRDTPGPEQYGECQVRELSEEGLAGWELLDGNGRLLRRFADTNGDQKIDIWSYYSAGVETYRDIDSDGNRKADQYRWLGTAGMRWGIDKNEDGDIDQWKLISAEEVTAEAVRALATADERSFALLVPEPAQIDALKLGERDTQLLKKRAADTRKDFAEAVKRQKELTPDSRWEHFAADKPGVIPAGTRGSEKDLTVYEGVVAVADTGGKSVQVLIGTLLKTGTGWRLVDVPRPAASDQPLTHAEGLFLPSTRQTTVAARPNTGDGEAMQELVTKLEVIDQKLAGEKDAKAIADLHADRGKVLQQLADAAPTAEERKIWLTQFAETVAAAVQNGAYPDGLAQLQSVAEKLSAADDPVAAFVAFNAISAEYGVRLQKAESDSEFAEAQELWLTSLDEFVEKYKDAPESASALLQLGLSSEFEGKDQAAIDWYSKVVSRFPEADAAVVAKGAISRLRSEGKKLEFSARTIDGEMVNLKDFRGSPVIIQYWATWCEPCKDDMVRLRRIQARYAKQNVKIVGINVDPQKSDAEAFLRATQLPWPQLFEEGGLERSRLATMLGVQTLPLMMVLDKEGRVVRNSVHAAELDEVIEEALK